MQAILSFISKNYYAVYLVVSVIFLIPVLIINIRKKKKKEENRIKQERIKMENICNTPRLFCVLNMKTESKYIVECSGIIQKYFKKVYGFPHSDVLILVKEGFFISGVTKSTDKYKSQLYFCPYGALSDVSVEDDNIRFKYISVDYRIPWIIHPYIDSKSQKDLIENTVDFIRDNIKKSTGIKLIEYCGIKDLYEEPSAVRTNSPSYSPSYSAPSPSYQSSSVDASQLAYRSVMNSMQNDIHSKLAPKPSSVVGQAVVGGIIAGPVGAVVGGLNAVDKNNRQAITEPNNAAAQYNRTYQQTYSPNVGISESTSTSASGTGVQSRTLTEDETQELENELLKALNDTPIPFSQIKEEISVFTNYTVQNISAGLRRLVTSGAVIRTEDKRQALFALTEKGIKLKEQLL